MRKKKVRASEKKGLFRKKKRPERQTVALPNLIDFSLSAAQLAVLLVGLATVLISIGSRASIWTVALRGGVAMVSLGLLLWLVNWMLSKGSLELARQELLEELEKQKAEQEDDGVDSTVEIKA
jgi:hypothetical protein